ncbi:MAG: hypothetical protein QOF21_1573 [Actinomycetota bacterium]|jgi:hypothetical protein
MTGLRATTIEELCHTLGLRTPIGLPATNAFTIPIRTYRNSDEATRGAEAAAVSQFTDEQLTALGVLAAPEAIAVVTQWPAPQPFAPATPVVHVIATRGAWLAEHVIEGEAHHLHAADADNAAILLLDRCGVPADGDDGDDEPRPADGINVTLHAYRRMTELITAGDHRRAVAALVADGAGPATADALVAAVNSGRTEVAGLSTASGAGGPASEGRRFVGCDLAVAGDEHTGRWLIPSTEHVDGLPKHAFRHPSFGTSGNLRVLIERVGDEALRDELSLIFGDA